MQGVEERVEEGPLSMDLAVLAAPDFPLNFSESVTENLHGLCTCYMNERER